VTSGSTDAAASWESPDTKRRPTTPTQLRREWLTGLIREVYVASRGTYGDTQEFGVRAVASEADIAAGGLQVTEGVET
jgi:hypothetical protein